MGKVLSCCCLIFCPLAVGNAQGGSFRNFDLVRLTEGVFAAVNKPGASAVSNAGIVDLGENALIFDTYMSLDAARELAAAAQHKLQKPVRYVVNSHYHKDHTRGNQAFAPHATVISSRWTREALLGSKIPDVATQSATLAAEITALRSKASAEHDERARKESMLTAGYYQGLLDSHKDLRLVPADVGIETAVTIHGHMRSVELVVPGGGSTPGDLFLYLPGERIVFAGDMVMVGMHPFISESDPGRWAESLRGMQRRPIAHLVPGHGPVCDSSAIAVMIDYLEGLKSLALSIQRENKTLEHNQSSMIPEGFRLWCYPDIYRTNLQYLLENGGKR